MTDKPQDWSATAHAYSTKIVQVTSQGGQALLSLLTTHFPPPSPQTASILDTGAGTGVLTSLLSTTYPGIQILATDSSPAMLAILSQKALPNVTTQLLDASASPVTQGLQPHTFTHVLSTFMIQFLPGDRGPQNAITHMSELLHPATGLLGIAIWTANSIAAPWDRACANLDPNYASVAAAAPFGKAMQSLADLEAAFAEAGMTDVVGEETEMGLEFESGQEFADYFLDSKNPPFLKVQEGWKGDVEEVRGELARVAGEEFSVGGGRVRIGMVAGCCVGRKN